MEDDEGMDDEMARMMGFSTFGTQAKDKGMLGSHLARTRHFLFISTLLRLLLSLPHTSINSYSQYLPDT